MVQRLFFILLLLLPFTGFAQSDIVHFENIGREDGLAQSTITGILQDSEGFMWFGTAEGLHRYDGYDFKIFKHDLRDTTSLANNYITAIYDDNNDHIWVGMNTGQLDLFDKKRQTFKHFTFINPRDSLINQYRINCITADDRGDILIGLNGGGMIVYTPDKNQWVSYTTSNSKLPNNSIRAFSSEVNGLGYWVSTLQGILLYNQSAFKTFRQLDTFKNQAVNDILHLGTKLYVVTKGQGLQIWDTKTDVVVAIPSPRIRGANFTSFILNGKDGNLWIGTDGAGLLKFSGDKYVTYRHNPYNYQSIIGDEVDVGYRSNDGTLWFGCRVGISKFSPNLKLFNLFNKFEKDKRPYSNNVYSIFETKDGHIWLGTLGGGLADFNPKTSTIEIYPILKDGEIETKSIRAIYEDKHGNLWVGSRDEGLFLLDRKTKKFKHYPPPKEMRVRTIQNIIEDANGTMWVATRWGLVKFDPLTGTYGLYSTKYLNNNPIYQIIDNPKRNELILVTFRSGLHIFNKKDESFIVMQHAKDSTSPSVNALMCIERIAEDSFLIGTYSGGLNIFDRKELSFTAITSQNGLPNDVVYGILPGVKDQYWLSTNDGLIQYDFVNQTFTQYDLSHYLQGLEYNEGAYWKTRDNTLYFGGQDGFNYFKAEDIKRPTFVYDIVLTSFKKGDQNVDLSLDINYLDQIEISYNENLISFGFAAISYTNPEKIRYEYQMEGFDNEWIKSGPRREAFYTHLSPGDHTFKVRATDEHGNQSTADRTIRVVVHPPVWQTWWFRILGILIFGGIIGLIFRQRTQSISKSYQHKLVDLELKALRSQMNPHFIFNSLNSIQYFVLKNEPKEAYTYLTKFSSLMRMILQNSRVKYITLEEECEWLDTYLDLERLRMEGKLDYTIFVDDALDHTKCYVPSMMIQPYVENAIIHGLLPKDKGNRNLKISFVKHHDKLRCQIEDNGIGRKKSAELNASRTKKHRSQGIQLTSERLEILTQDLPENPEFFIMDLHDNDGNASGTRVTLFLPIINKLKNEEA
jgi:ligand-binding sensor domain-containing protein